MDLRINEIPQTGAVENRTYQVGVHVAQVKTAPTKWEHHSGAGETAPTKWEHHSGAGGNTLNYFLLEDYHFSCGGIIARLQLVEIDTTRNRLTQFVVTVPIRRPAPVCVIPRTLMP